MITIKLSPQTKEELVKAIFDISHASGATNEYVLAFDPNDPSNPKRQGVYIDEVPFLEWDGFDVRHLADDIEEAQNILFYHGDKLEMAEDFLLGRDDIEDVEELYRRMDDGDTALEKEFEKFCEDAEDMAREWISLAMQGGFSIILRFEDGEYKIIF